jgi:hypothetical protein
MFSKDELLKRRSDLSPAKQALLQQRLRGRISSQETGQRLFPPIQPVSRDQPLPVSLSQEHLWHAVQKLPQTGYFNTPMNIYIGGAIEREILQRCLQEMIRRHEVLRTCFTEVDGQPTQLIAPELPFRLPFIDLGHLPSEEREHQLSMLALGYARWPLKLDEAPLLQVALLRLSELEHILLVTTHHIISDGWSIDVFVRELILLYQALARDESIDPATVLPALTVQFADYAVWQRSLIQSGAFDEQIRSWKQQLAGSESLCWPLKTTPPARRNFRYGYEMIVLPGPLTESVRQMSSQQGFSLFMIFLAALKTMLHGYTGQKDIKVGTLVANRSQVETESLIGYFLNLVILRLKFSEDMTFREVLQQVYRTSLDALAHQDAPVELVADAVYPEGSQERLFQVFFIFQSIAGSRIQGQGLRISSWTYIDKRRPYEVIPTGHDLWVEIKDEDGELMIVFKYKLDLFDQETGQALAQQLVRVLEQGITQIDRPLASWLA